MRCRYHSVFGRGIISSSCNVSSMKSGWLPPGTFSPAAFSPGDSTLSRKSASIRSALTLTKSLSSKRASSKVRTQRCSTLSGSNPRVVFQLSGEAPNITQQGSDAQPPIHCALGRARAPSLEFAQRRLLQIVRRGARLGPALGHYNIFS